MAHHWPAPARGRIAELRLKDIMAGPSRACTHALLGNASWRRANSHRAFCPHRCDQPPSSLGQASAPWRASLTIIDAAAGNALEDVEPVPTRSEQHPLPGKDAGRLFLQEMVREAIEPCDDPCVIYAIPPACQLFCKGVQLAFLSHMQACTVGQRANPATEIAAQHSARRYFLIVRGSVDPMAFTARQSRPPCDLADRHFLRNPQSRITLKSPMPIPPKPPQEIPPWTRVHLGQFSATLNTPTPRGARPDVTILARL